MQKVPLIPVAPYGVILNVTLEQLVTDCNGVIDNGFTLSLFYLDQDGDEYGDNSLPIAACIQSPGMVSVGGDCDDANFELNPSVIEICNNVDDNCDGIVDNGFDLDGDQWTVCEGDCNEQDPTINPGVLEGPFQEGTCDFIDNNCDGVVDEYWDQDQDGYTVCQGDCDDYDDCSADRHPHDCQWSLRQTLGYCVTVHPSYLLNSLASSRRNYPARWAAGEAPRGDGA